MSSRVLEMEKTHIVYKFYERKNVETDEFFYAHRIKNVPVILVFNKGRVVARYEGAWEIATILKGIKTKEEQSWYPSWLRLW